MVKWLKCPLVHISLLCPLSWCSSPVNIPPFDHLFVCQQQLTGASRFISSFRKCQRQQWSSSKSSERPGRRDNVRHSAIVSGLKVGEMINAKTPSWILEKDLCGVELQRVNNVFVGQFWIVQIIIVIDDRAASDYHYSYPQHRLQPPTSLESPNPLSLSLVDISKF